MTFAMEYNKEAYEADPAHSATVQSEQAIVEYDTILPDTDPAYQNALRSYFAELKKNPVLKPEEEKKYAVAWYEHKDKQAAYHLVVGNLRLVVKIALQYQRAVVQLLDLIQEGNVGLMMAVQKFNPYKGVKLSSYASWWIKAYIIRYLLNNWRMVKIGTTQAQRKLFFNLQKEKRRLEAQGIKPTPQLIGQSLEVPTKVVVEMEQRLGSSDVSTDMTVGESEKVTIGDMLSGDAPAADDLLADHQDMERFRAALAEFELDLTDKEGFVLHHRLMADEPLTLREIGEHYAISRERVRQIETRLLEKLRTFLEERGLDEVLRVD